MKKFRQHPNTVGETYWEHFMVASRYGFKFLKLAACCFIHAVTPWKHETTASDCVTNLHYEMCERNKQANPIK